MVRTSFLLLLLLVFSAFVYSQESPAELEKRVKNLKGKERFDALYQLSKIYLAQSPKKSIDFGRKAIDEAKRLKDPNLQADAYNLVGTAYYNQENFRSAIKYYEDELVIRQSLKQESSTIKIKYNLGSINEASGKPTKAVEYYLSALEGAKKRKMTTMMFQCYESIIRVYVANKRFQEAYENLRAYMELKSISLPSTERKKLAILETKYLEEKIAKEKTEAVLKEKDSTLSLVKEEKEMLETDTAAKGQAITSLTIETEEQKLTIEQQREEVRRQRQWIMAFAAFIAVVVIFSILLFKQFRAKKKALELLKIQHAEIIEQKEEIQSLADKLIKSNNDIYEQKEEIRVQAEQLSIVNKEVVLQRDEIMFQKAQITDSIIYASRIQNVMLPPDEFLDQLFNEWMVLWRPQEIVSGDFYWVKKIKNFITFAVADCTGHGVPGAFMSMLGISFLNEIVTKSRFDKTNEILELLRKRVKTALNQTGKANEAADGMDIAFCILDTETNVLQFSGAYNPLFLIREGQLQVVKADMQPIAIYPRERDFTYNEINVQKGDVIYIFTDGFIDQFGGEQNDKLKSSGFKKVLLQISHLPMKDQKAVLNDFIDNWMGAKNVQVDDILILGIKI
jgi:serine phosphatase RsbU (regulator of sigma subunit)